MKKMPPLPKGATQSPEPKAARGSGAGLDDQVRQQRARARKRARQVKQSMEDRTPEEVLEALVTAAAEMQAATQEIGAAGRELEGTMNEIASASRQAASAAAESSAAVVQILGGSQIARDRSGASLAVMTSLSAVIGATTDAMTDLVSGINLAVSVNSEASVSVKGVQEESNKIRGIVRAVTEVADQINLFAFNAALEASRAGKHGAGFSIVSDEVRTLAQRANEAAHGIEEVLADIESAVAKVAANMESAVSDSRTWATQANEVLQTLERSSRAVAGVTSASQAISDQTASLITAMDRTAGLSDEVMRATESAEAAAMESANVLAEQSNALRGIEAAAEELARKTEQGRGEGAAGGVLEEIGTITDELGATIQEAASAAQQIGASVRQIAREAEVLAQLSRENLPAVQQSQRVMQDVLERSTTSEKEVAELRELLGSATTEITTIIDNVARAAELNVGYANDVKALQAQIMRVDEVIDSLISISIMTNLLSVSGRMEGVRAGEVGAGFTTVSEDIRQLAEETSGSVISVRRMIRGVQLSINTVASELEKAGVGARTEVEKAKKVTSQLSRVETETQEAIESALEVRKATESASAGVPQARAAIQMISDAASQAASATAEASSASMEQAEAMVELANTVDDMALQLTYIGKS